jgi:hypothetical protein
MAHTIERSLSSLTAIAAASLLLSTPAHSQATAQPPAAEPQATMPASQPAPPPATPVAETPAAPTPEAPAPTPPAATASPAPVMTTNPVVQAIPDNSAALDKAPVATQTTARPAQTAPRAHITAAPIATKAAPQATTPQAPAPRAPAATTPAATPDTTPSGLVRRDPAGLYSGSQTQTATATTRAPAATHQSPFARYWPLEAGGIIVLAGLAGFALTRRREDEEEQAYEPAYEPVSTPAQAPVQAAKPQPANLAVEEAPAASVLPAGPVPTGAAREALLKRMVEAEPDAANPFVTAKARRRRASLILQARKEALRQQATEAFDWRTYRPSLTHPTLGTPAKSKPAKAKAETTK